MTVTLFEVLKQIFKKPATNPFPVKYAPDNMHAAVPLIVEGKINPPVPVPERFRGKIEYDRTACIGCRMCITVCPAEAIEYIDPPEGEKKGKVKFNMSRCTFCGFCTDTCPKNCIRMGKDFLMATTDRFSEDLTVYDSGNFTSDESYNPDE